MTKRARGILAGFLLLLGVAIAGSGYCANRWIFHRGEGEIHSYPLPGSAVLTDEQAISLARQTLQADSRFSEKMELETSDDGRAVNRGDDKSYVSLSWRYPGTNDRWFVQLHRMPDRVEAVSSPGR